MTFRLEIDSRNFRRALARRFRTVQRRAGDKMTEALVAAAPVQDAAMRAAARPTHLNQPILRDSIRGEMDGDKYVITMAAHAVFSDKGTKTPITPVSAARMPVPVRTDDGIRVVPLESVRGQEGTGWRTDILNRYTRFLKDEF